MHRINLIKLGTAAFLLALAPGILTSSVHAQSAPDPAKVEQACNSGNQSACALFGLMLASGNGMPQDRARGLKYLEQACADGQTKICGQRDKLKDAMAEPMAIKPSVTSPDPAKNLYRPFVPAIYKIYSINAGDLSFFKSAIAKTANGTLLKHPTHRLEGQRGDIRQYSGVGWVSLQYDLGVYATWDAAHETIGRTLVSAGSAFGSDPRYVSYAANDESEKRYKVFDSKRPGLSGTATLSKRGRADGSISATFDLDSRDDEKAEHGANANTFTPGSAPSLSLIDALKLLIASAPNNFTKMRDEKSLSSTGRMNGTLRIAGASTTGHSVNITGQIRYFFPFANGLNEADATKNLIQLQEVAKTSLGRGAKIEIITAPDGSKIDYMVTNNSSATIQITQSKASLGRGFNQYITVLKRLEKTDI